MEQIATPSVPVPRFTKFGPTPLREQAVGATPMPTFNPQTFLKQAGNDKTTLKSPKKQILFSQGDASDAVFYIQAGKVKLTVVSPRGKEAVIVILQPGSFFGEGCLAGQPVHLATATVVEDARIVRIDKPSMRRLLHDDGTFSALFTSYML